jgi:hypothetical protein
VHTNERQLFDSAEHSTSRAPADGAAGQALQNSNAMRLLSRRHRRTPVDFRVRQHDAAPHINRRALIILRITERERERMEEKDKGLGGLP